ncbi:ESX secretion-associated protein EspG [Umezawaea beigongshangensis]|uniref:ESX secretion-associated protein EspG n=1 Tax=Umezawaea beigongshangensis TaxID=2780383 RepID=UPI0018F241A3|nr:ESX secretion-associated protein EspG [Umezawaea beigongshangensis]
MLHSRVAIPVVALYNAWQAIGLPVLHRALIAEIDFDESRVEEGDLSGLANLARDGWGALERVGLARGRDVHPDLARSLQLIARAGTEYYAFFNHEDEKTRSALVVKSGDDALRVVLTADEKFVLEPVRAEDAAQALIAVLPEVPPGRGAAISLPADAMNARAKQRRDDDEGGGSFLQPSRPTGTNSTQVEQLRKLMQEKRLGGGQLYAAGRDRFGKKVRCPAPMTYVDTVTGRYATLKLPGRDGATWITVQPADFRTMSGRLQQLSATLT